MIDLINRPGLYILIAFFSFLFGYALGRRHGRSQGFLEGVNVAPLEMRRQTWERGRCVICGHAAEEPDTEALLAEPTQTSRSAETAGDVQKVDRTASEFESV